MYAELVVNVKRASRCAGAGAGPKQCIFIGTTVNGAYGRLTLRDTSSGWGAWSTQGNLNVSSRLIMAPPEVLR